MPEPAAILFVLVVHPGHGSGSASSFLHYLTEPYHALPIAAVFAVVAVGMAALRKRGRASG